VLGTIVAVTVFVHKDVTTVTANIQHITILQVLKVVVDLKLVQLLNVAVVGMLTVQADVGELVTAVQAVQKAVHHTVGC
jgi:hypothetical protein